MSNVVLAEGAQWLLGLNQENPASTVAVISLSSRVSEPKCPT